MVDCSGAGHSLRVDEPDRQNSGQQSAPCSLSSSPTSCFTSSLLSEVQSQEADCKRANAEPLDRHKLTFFHKMTFVRGVHQSDVESTS